MQSKDHERSPRFLESPDIAFFHAALLHLSIPGLKYSACGKFGFQACRPRFQDEISPELGKYHTFRQFSIVVSTSDKRSQTKSN